METITVALLQASAIENNPEANLAIGEQHCREAAALGADLTLFPEMWQIGYSSCPKDPLNAKEWQKQAINEKSVFVSTFCRLAKELDMAIALTYLKKARGLPKNALSLIDRHGNIKFTYSKVHTCDFGMEAALAPGNDFFVSTLDTRQGPLQVGGMICYDREFPESARILMLKGAELIITPNSCLLERHRLHQFETRAFENMLAVAMANYPPPKANGHSVAFDGMAFNNDEEPKSSLIILANKRPGIYLAKIPIGTLRLWRQKETWGNAYRKPHCYELLTSDSVKLPFKRGDSRR